MAEMRDVGATPWSVRRYHDDGKSTYRTPRAAEVLDGNGCPIARFSSKICGGGPESGKELVSWPQAEAQADLCAAAPDLYAACEDALSTLDECDPWDAYANLSADAKDRLVVALRAALLKARGGA